MTSPDRPLDIRTLLSSQCDAAVALWDAAGLRRPFGDPFAELARALAEPNATVLAGMQGETLVATVLVGDDGHMGWVYYVAVAPSCRGRGYGAAMLAAAEAWLRARGVSSLQFMVHASNTGAIAFYEAIGYVHSDVRIMYKPIA